LPGHEFNADIRIWWVKSGDPIQAHHFTEQQSEDGDPVEPGEQAGSLARRYPQMSIRGRRQLDR